MEKVREQQCISWADLRGNRKFILANTGCRSYFRLADYPEFSEWLVPRRMIRQHPGSLACCAVKEVRRLSAAYAICKLRQSSGLMDTAGVARFGSVIKVWLGAVRKFLRKLYRKEPRMEKRMYKLGHHLVAFLDVLGQRDKFRGLKKPTNAQEEDEVKEVLRQTAGFVAELRTVFQPNSRSSKLAHQICSDTRKSRCVRVSSASPIHSSLQFPCGKSVMSWCRL